VELTWLGQSCVRIEKDGTVLVIDPGLAAPAHALDDADAVLITHEHSDHLAIPLLMSAVRTRRHLEIWTNRSVANLLEGTGARVHQVDDGDTFDVMGIPISVHGSWHGQVHHEIPPVRNVGFLVDSTLFHPGDALTDPATPVGALLLPLCGRWVPRVGKLLDYVRQVRPQRVIPVHDTGAAPINLQVHASFLSKDPIPNATPGTGTPYTPLTTLEPTTL
jgi:L-ascorbate metabolism protein UlaG (beta-lactamase superfamily)